jgi:hypothetical protein
MAEISFNLVDYDHTVFTQVIARDTSGTYGTALSSGTLLLGDSNQPKACRLLIHTTTQPLNFPYAWWTNPMDFNKGNLETQRAMTFRAIRGGDGLPSNENVLWNTTTS